MTRLLFDARSLAEPSGGVSRVAARILAHLRATRPTSEIILMTTGWKKSDAPSLYLRLPNKLWSLACFLGLTSLDRAAIAISHSSFDEMFLPNVGFVGTPHIPYTIVVHDLSFLIEPRWFSWRMRLWHRAVHAKQLIRNAKQIWCVSETTAQDVRRVLGIAREKIEVLPAAVVAGMALAPTAPHPSPIATPYILAFSDGPRKNVSTAIATVAHLREEDAFKNLRLVIIGSPPASLPSFVTVRNPTDAELADLYAHASALLYPSWYEGFGLPLHEAATYRIPMLASAHGALPETAPPGAILVPPSKPHLWVTALRGALIDFSGIL